MKILQFVTVAVLLSLHSETHAQVDERLNCSDLVQLREKQYYHKINIISNYRRPMLYAAITNEGNIWLSVPPNLNPQLYDVSKGLLLPAIGKETAISIGLDDEGNLYFATDVGIYKYIARSALTKTFLLARANNLIVRSKELFFSSYGTSIIRVDLISLSVSVIISAKEISSIAPTFKDFTITKNNILFFTVNESESVYLFRKRHSIKKIDLPMPCDNQVTISWSEHGKILFIVCNQRVFYVTLKNRVPKLATGFNLVDFFHVDLRTGNVLTQEQKKLSNTKKLCLYILYKDNPCTKRLMDKAKISASVIILPLLIDALILMLVGLGVVIKTLFCPYKDQIYDLQDIDDEK